MKLILCCLVLLSALSCINSMHVDKNIHDKCLKESQLSSGEMEFKNEIKDATQKSFCYLNCMAVNVNFWNITPEETMEMIGHLSDEEKKLTLRECLKEVQKSEDCEAGRKIHACIEASGMLG